MTFLRGSFLLVIYLQDSQFEKDFHRIGRLELSDKITTPFKLINIHYVKHIYVILIIITNILEVYLFRRHNYVFDVQNYYYVLKNCVSL